MASAEKYQTARIVWRKDFAPDLWSVRIAPDNPVAFEPGQYVTLGVERDGKVIERAYSVVSSPRESELEFFFELVPQGQLTPLLYELKTGDSLLVRHRAKGAFTLTQANERKDHFFATTVTGIAPVVSIVRTLRREPVPGVRLVVLQAASRSHELGYREELEAAAHESGGWLRYIPLVSRPWEDASWKGEVGRTEDVLRKHLDESGCDPRTTTAYLCGHPMMIENGKGILLRRGFDRENIHVEVYWMPKKQKPSAPASP
jgi:ferredoxin/flavodoxin---NADP+ reductase